MEQSFKNKSVVNHEQRSENNEQIEYINENLEDFDHSFYNTDTDCVLHSSPIVKELEQCSMRQTVPVMKSSIDSKMLILTGNIIQVLKWSSYLEGCQIYETIGIYVSDWYSGSHFQRGLLLRQPEGRQVLKVNIFPRKYPEVPNCVPGQYLKVVGRISTENQMIAEKVSCATEFNYHSLVRVGQVCDRVTKLSF